MWSCPYCHQSFKNKNQTHSCNERTEADFLKGKSKEMTELYFHFIERYQTLGAFVLHPAKSRIAFAAKTRFGYIHRIGKNFLDIVLTFPQPHPDNLCFYRIGEVPGGKIFQHYLRLYSQNDINDEVIHFMQLALEYGNR